MTTRFPAVAGLLLLVCLVGCTMTPASEQTTGQVPPLGLASDEVVVDDSAFERRCIEDFEYIVQRMRMVLRKTVVSQSDYFGLVFRADFDLDEIPAPYNTNRLVCWMSTDSRLQIIVAPSQDIAPL